MDKVVNLRDLAVLAGCSRTAVSMALRNHPKISKKNRERIQKLAAEQGYTRDPVVSTLMNRLRSGRMNRTVEKLGVIAWSAAPKEVREGRAKDLFGDQLKEGTGQQALRLGYEVEEFNARAPGMTADRLSRILYNRGIRGILLMSKPRARGHVSLHWPYFAAASIGYTNVKPALPRAVHSYYQGMMLALRSLRSRGYERIGFVNLLETEDMVNEEWLAAYLAYQFRTLGKIETAPLLLETWDARKLRSWLRKNKVQAVVSNWKQPYQLMLEIGYRIPEDIGFASLDCLPGNDLFAGVHQLRDKIATLAVDLVVEQLEKHSLGLPENPKTVFVNGVWKDGSSISL